MKKIILTLSLIVFIFLNLLSQDYNLLEAVSDNDEKKVFQLLKKGSDPNTKTYEGVTPLMYAVDKGNIYITKLLIQYGADVNAMPYNKTTALIAAAKNNQPEVIDILLQNGAKIEAEDNDKKTALMYAAAYGYPLAVDILCYHGAKIDYPDTDNSPLLLAAYYGDKEIAEILIKYKANVNTKDFLKYTPLMVAAQNGYLETVKLLIKNKAEKEFKNYNNLTALDIAAKKGNKDIVEFLISAGANPNNKITKKTTTCTLSRTYGFDSIADLVSKNSKTSFKFNFNKYSISFINNFGLNDFHKFGGMDYILGLGFNAHETKLKFDISGSFMIRPYRKNVLIKEREHFFFKYKEFRAGINIGLKKRFSIKNGSGVFIGGSGALFFGKYLGTIKDFIDFTASPNVGGYYHGKAIGVDLSYEFRKFNTYKNNPHRINLSFLFFINKGYKRFPDKIIGDF